MPHFPIPNILSILTFTPLLGALVIMFLPRPKDLPEHHGDHDSHDDHGALPAEEKMPADPARTLVNAIAILFTLIPFVLSIWLFAVFQSDYANPEVNGMGRNMQFIESAKWIEMGNLKIFYRMGIDGISLLLIALTTFLSVLCVVFSGKTKQRLKEFMVFLLLLETAMIGVFCALDLVLFYVFWEAMLIPMYFLIGIFGHERKIYAAIKFFLYTFAGSIFMLIAIVMVYQVTGSFNLLALADAGSGPGNSLAHLNSTDPRMLMWMFGAFALAFTIKVPMFPFHTWLPDAHVEAPTAGSVILAGVMLKMGTYGLIRFCLPLFPEQARQSAPLFIVLAIVGIIYGSMVAAVQPDAKKLIAYSSVAHLGFVILGIFSFNRIGMMGALIQNINHGISTPMLFFMVGMLYERRHTREIKEYGGLKLVVPMMATMLLLATLSSIAVPFFNGFVGEFTILLGSWTSLTAGFWPTAFAATGMILSAVYMLWWFQRLMLGPITRPVNRHLPDLTRTEWVVLAPLAGMIFWIGLGSHFWTQRMDAPVDTLLPLAAEAMNSDLPVEKLLVRQREKDLRDERGTGKLMPPANIPTPQFNLQMRNANPQTPGSAPSGGTPPGANPTPPSSGTGIPPAGSPGTRTGEPKSGETIPGAQNPAPQGENSQTPGTITNPAPGMSPAGGAGNARPGATAPSGTPGSGPAPAVPANPPFNPPASDSKAAPNKGARRENGRKVAHTLSSGREVLARW